MKSKQVKVAVIGAGNMGHNHIRNYKNMKSVDLLAIADPSPAAKKLAKQYKIAYFSDYNQMLEDLELDAVSVAVPTPLHLAVGEAVMTKGVACLLEKPIASSVSEAKKLMAIAKKHKVIFTVGHIERYNPVIIKLKKMIDRGKLGRITSITCKRVGGFPRVEPKTDVIIDLAVHDIDIINSLFDRSPVAIHSHGSRTVHSRKVDAAEMLLDYGEASGFLQANWLTPVKIRTIQVTGSRGYVEGNYITQELTYYEHNMQDIHDYNKFVATLGEPKQETVRVKFQEPLGLELQAFVDAVISNNASALVKPEQATEALRIALKGVSQIKM